MTDAVWLDSDLKCAAEKVANTMLSALPTPKECERGFTEAFQQKMEPLYRKSRRMAASRRICQRVAAVLIVLLLSVSTWLAVDAEAREHVIQWFKEVYESMTVYHFDGNETGKTLSGYDATWLPEGFVLQDSSHEGSQICDIYVNKVSGEVFLIECTFMNDAAMTITGHGTVDSVKYDINGIPGEFYGTDENSANQALIWVDEDAAVVLTIQGNITEQDMVHIARGLVLSKSTK